MDTKSTVIIQASVFENKKFKTNPDASKERDLAINFNGERCILVNRSVLFERCNFFTSMKKHSFKDANAAEIDITYDLDVTIFKAVMEYVHTSKIEVSTGNVEGIVRAAQYFQLYDLLKYCCGVLKQNINLQTVGFIYNIVRENALLEIKKAGLEFEEEHFQRIAKGHDFLEWALDCMVDLLSSDRIIVSHEKKVLKFVFEWLQFDARTRVEHAADLFRKLRFSYLTKKNMNEVVEESSNKTLGETLHREASKSSNKITAPRVYHKGVYLLGFDVYDTDDSVFVHYCPEDSSVTILTHRMLRPSDVADAKLLVNNDDIYMVRCEGQYAIHIERYDVVKDTWTLTTTKQLEKELHVDPNTMSVSYCQEKILVFVKRNMDISVAETIYWMYCCKTDTWKTLNLDDVHSVFLRSASCGDGVYITQHHSKDLLQYTPSTDEWNAFPCELELEFYVPIAYKSKILLFPNLSSTMRTLLVFNTDTKDFQYYSVEDIYNDNQIGRYEAVTFTLYNEFVYIFLDKYCNVVKLDLSFVDGMMEPTVLSLPDAGFDMEHMVIDIVSIQ